MRRRLSPLAREMLRAMAKEPETAWTMPGDLFDELERARLAKKVVMFHTYQEKLDQREASKIIFVVTRWVTARITFRGRCALAAQSEAMKR